ncbi:MAG TPA: hypothetical protein VIK92_01085 [Thermaerobacter sp.]
MAEPAGGQEPANERIPWPQLLLDNEFFLLGLGLVVPVVLYIVWGLIELAQLPLFPK